MNTDTTTTTEELTDELNPAYIFSQTDSSLLLDALNGKVNLDYLATKELAARGLGRSGEWVVFSEAKKVWGLK